MQHKPLAFVLVRVRSIFALVCCSALIRETWTHSFGTSTVWTIFFEALRTCTRYFPVKETSETVEQWWLVSVISAARAIAPASRLAALPRRAPRICLPDRHLQPPPATRRSRRCRPRGASCCSKATRSSTRIQYALCSRALSAVTYAQQRRFTWRCYAFD